MRTILLLLSAIYMALVGCALIFLPRQFGTGAVPADASPELIALLRLLGGPFLGIAVLNWLTRRLDTGSVLRPILLANLVGFGAVALNDLWGVVSGEAREIAKLFLVIHSLFALSFLLALKPDRSDPC